MYVGALNQISIFPLQNYGNSNELECRAYTNAYMLVYMADDARDEVLCPVTDDMIPFNLTNRFREERSVEEIERRAKDQAHEFATANVLLDEDFYGFEVTSTTSIIFLWIDKTHTLH